MQFSPREYLPCGVPTFLLISDRDVLGPPSLQNEWESALCVDVHSVETGDHFKKLAHLLSEATDWIVAGEARGQRWGQRRQMSWIAK